MDLDYNTRLAAIQRNEKLAQIMQQQAFQPVEIQSYNGIQAPISPLSSLAKVLQAYMGAKGTGDEERIKLAQEAKKEAQQMLSSLNPTASPGRAAVMGRPEVPAQAATSFKPMGADYEDNPNLQTAPSGNVETPAVPYQPAVAPQAAIPAQPAMQLTNEEKNKKLVEIMMGQNPYAAPVAKLMYESLEKQNSGPLAEYRLAQQQGYKGTMKDYQIEQSLAKRPPPNNTVVNMPHGAAQIGVDPVTGKQFFFQTGPNGKIARVEGVVPKSEETTLSKFIAARDALPKDHPDRPLYDALIAKETTQSFAPNATVERPGKEPQQIAPAPAENTVNVMIDGKLTAVPIAQAAELTAKFKGMVAKSTGQAEAELDLVSVPDPKGTGAKVLIPRSQLVTQAEKGTPAISQVDTKSQQGNTVLDVARRAELVLPKASSGIISNLFTMATDAAGIPTDKSAADAQLRVLGGQLTLAQPRMEGPQSNADSILYQQMAAEVANPNRPYQTRMKALNTVIELNEKYAPTPTAPPPGAVRRITPK
jgi:hypothetical protein